MGIVVWEGKYNKLIARLRVQIPFAEKQKSKIRQTCWSFVFFGGEYRKYRFIIWGMFFILYLCKFWRFCRRTLFRWCTFPVSQRRQPEVGKDNWCGRGRVQPPWVKKQMDITHLQIRNHSKTSATSCVCILYHLSATITTWCYFELMS